MSKYRQHCYSDVIVLAFYLRLLCSISVPTENKVYAKSHIYEDLTKSCQKELSTFNSNITDLHRTLFGEYKIIDHIIDEFVSWSKYLNFDLSNKNNVNYLNQVAKYTYYGWIAYTASDSIVDDQISKKYLPIGNHFLFKSSNIINNVIYSTCGSNLKVLSKVQDYIDTIYQRLHRANYIESNSSIRNMRDVLYTLNNKSIGHSIGFLILYIKQKEYNLRDMDLILKYFDLHLSMRQLSDDIHDWRIDIEQKRVTLPTFLLRNIKKKGREVYINHNIIPKVHKHMQTLKTSLDTTLKKLRHILNTEDRIRLSDQSHKYLRGVKQAIKEIEFYKKIKEQSIN